ncbi:MAG TPA: hypothetical protein PLQ34_09765 [Ferrovaceae bacterium]|nr:hypothetical protein [Ferrovaceae bacterium]
MLLEDCLNKKKLEEEKEYERKPVKPEDHYQKVVKKDGVVVTYSKHFFEIRIDCNEGKIWEQPIITYIKSWLRYREMN